MSDCVQPAHTPFAAACREIPALAVVLDPAKLRKHLDFFSLPPWNWGTLNQVEVQPLKAHASRCTVEIRLRAGSAWHTVMGKVYLADRSDVFRAMESISQAGFGSDAEFSIPQPIAYLPALNLLLQEKVQGTRAKDLLVGGREPERAEVAERCALWLVQFQTMAPRSGPVVDLDRHLTSLEHWRRPAAAGNEPLEHKARRLLEGLRAVAPARATEACAGHGSYCYSQIIFANGRTVTYDWDGYDTADPSRDVARFIVAINRLGLRYLGSIRALDHVAETFLKTYLARGRQTVEDRLPFFKAGACIKLAKYEIPRPPNPRRTSLIEGLLDEGFRCLEECN